MSKFNRDVAPARFGPLDSSQDADAVTHEGGPARTRDARSELFLTAVTSMVGEATFYESAEARDKRLRELVREATATDPEWVARLVGYLRRELHLRSVAVLVACEYVAAGGPGGRAVVRSACRRADEPGEVVAYWLARHGKPLPKPVKRGVRDAAEALYDERAALRYDGARASVSLGDVVALTHPRPEHGRHEREEASALYRYLLDKTHGHDDPRGLEHLAQLRAVRGLREYDAETREEQWAHHGEWVADTLGSWEAVASWLGRSFEAADWARVVPSMGYMALLRNLRNFDDADLGDDVAARVAARLADPGEVARSRQLPLRFLSAHKAVSSVRWSAALEAALDHSLAHVPALAGETLVLWDCSGSMASSAFGERSTAQRWEQAGVFALALARRAAHATVVAYSDSAVVLDPVGPRDSVLRRVEQVRDDARLWRGTDTFGVLAAMLDRVAPDRVVLVTDEQAHHWGAGTGRWVSGRRYGKSVDPVVLLDRVPRSYTLNVAGYAPAHLPETGTHAAFGGLSDAAFHAIAALEGAHGATWPF